MYFIITNAYQSPLVNIYFNDKRPDFFWNAIKDYLLTVLAGYDITYIPDVPKIRLRLYNPASMLFINVLRNLLQKRYDADWQYLRDIPTLLQITLDTIRKPEDFANALCYYQQSHGLSEALRAVYIYYRDFT